MLTILQKNQFPAPQSSKPDPIKISSKNLIIVVNLIWDKAVFYIFKQKAFNLKQFQPPQNMFFF